MSFQFHTIQEDSVGDMNLHYGGCLVYDQDKDNFAVAFEFGRRTIVEYYGSDEPEQADKGSLNGVLIPDQYYQIGPVVAHISRKVERKFKKATTLSNVSVLMEPHHPHFSEQLQENNPRTNFKLVDVVLNDDCFTVHGAVNALNQETHSACKINDSVAITVNPDVRVYNVLYKGRKVGLCNREGKVLLFVPELKEYFKETNII